MKISEDLFPFTRSRWAVAALIIALMVTAVSSCSDDSNEGHDQHSPAASTAADPHAGHNMGEMSDGSQMSPVDHSQHADPLKQEAEVWSCSMHPHIHRDGPGQCPICGMDLIPVPTEESSDMDMGRQISVSASQKALMRIETAPVERRFPVASLRLVGKVTYDETNLAYITAWIPGRIDRLFVDYTGLTVKEGDHMVELYSPELFSAQEELLQATRGLREVSKSGLSSLRESAKGTVAAARDKLRLWGLTVAQIAELEKSGKPQENVTIYSPSSGVVIHKDAQEGMYVQTGSRIFTIADLSAVWVQLDAYESDLQWLRYGQQAEFTTEAFPGETFTGRIAFIDPVLNPKTRTVKVRVNVDNSDGRLKPDMFVRASVSARLATGGKVVDEELAGKWVSPMHPEVLSDEPGNCPVCGMALVKTESLGFAVESTEGIQPPIVIPASAALLTGQRAVVYVEDPHAEKPTYVGREVTLGARAGADYIVVSGLSEGELVVVSGNFKIDSALQIQAKPSMMNPEGGGSTGGHNH